MSYNSCKVITVYLNNYAIWESIYDEFDNICLKEIKKECMLDKKIKVADFKPVCRKKGWKMYKYKKIEILVLYGKESDVEGCKEQYDSFVKFGRFFENDY